MGFDLNKIQKGGKQDRHIMILATCEDCGKTRAVRKSWALKKVRENSMLYYCSKCNGKRNIKKARRRKMDNDLVDEFVWLSSEIFSNLWDDKSEYWLARKLNSKSTNLIAMARDFVFEYLEEGPSNEIIECAEYFENNADAEILNLYNWQTQLKAQALLKLEQLPRPEGL